MLCSNWKKQKSRIFLLVDLGSRCFSVRNELKRSDEPRQVRGCEAMKIIYVQSKKNSGLSTFTFQMFG